MKYHLKYIISVLRHKWLVLQAAYRLGITWRGLWHDWSKFLPSEWMPRVRSLRAYNLDLNKTAWSPDMVEDEMQLCWLKHYHRNPHHWQWWVILLDSGSQKAFPMSDNYRREMLADWIAVSQRPDRLDIIPWYRQNKDKFILHPETRAWVEQELEKL